VVVEVVRPHRHDGHGATWRALEAEAEQIRAWIDDQGLTVAKVRELLARRGLEVPMRTLTRFSTELCGPRRGRSTTVRVADGKPGDELQVDFGRMGMLYDSEGDRRRVAHALMFTACYSRYSFVWLTFSQTIEAVIEGFEEAWAFSVVSKAREGCGQIAGCRGGSRWPASRAAGARHNRAGPIRWLPWRGHRQAFLTTS
jgi:transposase